ncbi:MAG: ArnT family glycosyltransferase [Solirubrobacterales bacterium]
MSRGRVPWLAALVTLATAVLLFGFGYADDPILGGDGPAYDRYAQNLIDNSAFSPADEPPYFPGVDRAPGYPGFLAFFHLLSDDPVVIRLAQLGLIFGTAILLALLAAPLLGARTATVAAVLCATYIPLLELANYHLTEVLATFLVVGLMLVATRAARPRASWPAWCAVGALAGILALVRPSMALLAPLVAIAVAFARPRSEGVRSRVLPGLAVIAAFGLVLVPWAIRNQSVSERFAPLGTLSNASLFFSLEQYRGGAGYAGTPAEQQELADDGTRRRRAILHSLAERDQAATIARGTALQLELSDSYAESNRELIEELSPFDVIADIPRRLQALWGTADFPPSRLESLVHRLAQAQWVVLILLAAVGVWAGRARWIQLWPVWLVPAYLTLLHFVFQAEARYTIPGRPFLLVFSAVGALVLWKLIAGRISPDDEITTPHAAETPRA